MKTAGILYLLLHMISLSTRGENATKAITTLHDILPPHYDYLHPPMEEGKPVNVTVHLIILGIRSVDENDMSFSVAIELWQYWRDRRLTCPNATSDAYNLLDSGWKDKIWNPSLYFVNAIEGKLDNIITPSSFFWLDNMSNIYYCSKYPDRKVLLQWSPDTAGFPKMNFTGLPQYNLGELEKSQCSAMLGITNSSCLVATVSLIRRTGYYIINVYIPTILIVLMSMLTFWIPPDAIPARVTLGVTSLLTIITKQYETSLPNVSYVVALNLWLSCCIAFVFLSLVEYAAVIAITSRGKNDSNRETSEECLLPMIQLRINGTWYVKKAWKEAKGKKFEPKHLDFISRVMFPFLFGIFCIAYWLSYDN